MNVINEISTPGGVVILTIQIMSERIHEHLKYWHGNR
jgi:hypothetical protein